MTFIPTVRCSLIQASTRFYTEILDFELLDGSQGARDPGFVVLRWDGAVLFLSSHAGDGTFGQVIAMAVPDVNAVFRTLRARGLRTPGDPSAPTEVHEGPIVQTWGTLEFYVDDPDGNTLRFIEGLRIPDPDHAP